MEIASNPPLEIRAARAFPEMVLSLYLSLLLASSRHRTFDLLVNGVLRLARGNWSLERVVRENPTVAVLIDLFGQWNLDKASTLADLIDGYLDDDNLANGLPLYVSVFRSKGTFRDLAWAAAGATGILDTPESEFFHVQSLDKAQFRQSILASAALPLVFEAQTIGSTPYADGGMGGWLRVQGNTPVTPLLKEAACQYLIVTHLTDGSLWDRHAFPDAVSLEIRPGKAIARRGGLRDTLAFDSSVIVDWIQQGYEDTERCLLAVRNVLESIAAGRFAQQRLDEALSKL
jgi:NTE family protein